MSMVTITLNGTRRTFEAEPQETLLHLLREKAGLTGVKCGCELGECGACTVIYNGRAVNSCCVLAEQADGSDVVTIEGIATAEHPHPLQQAFYRCRRQFSAGSVRQALILSAKALLDRNPHPDEDTIRAALSGNLCRCTGYSKIVEAIQLAVGRMEQEAQK